MKKIKYFILSIIFIILLILAIYLSVSYYHKNIKEIPKFKRYIEFIDKLFVKIEKRLPAPKQPIIKEEKKFFVEEKIEKEEVKKTLPAEEIENIQIRTAFIQNSFIKIKSNSRTFNILPIEKKYLLFYNFDLENEFQILNRDLEYKIFTNPLNKITIIKLFENNLIKNEIKINQEKLNINDEIYIIKKDSNNNLISLKSLIISKNNNFENYKYINLYRVQGYFDNEFLGAYIFNKDYEFIGIAVYIHQSKSNNLYFIDNTEILKHISTIDNLENIKFFNLSFDFEFSDLLKIKNSRTHNFKDNNIIIGMDGFEIKTEEEFQNLIYYGLLKQELEIKFNTNLVKKILADEKYSFFENEYGIYFKETDYGLEIAGTEKGNNFLKIKGLNIGDVLVSINNINLFSRLDFYLIRNLLNDKTIKKTALFRTIRNTYVFFDL